MTRDNRIGLKNNTIIHFGNKNSGEGKDVQITGEIGRGASCIVYDAIYLDNIGVQHKVRVKECYPSHLPIHRDQENQLIPSEYNRDKFVIAKKKFVDAYKQSAKIRNTLGLINSTINSTDTTSCNNTIYIKMELDEGSDYGKYEDGSLKSLFVHMKSLAQLIQKYHQNGYLYLDIKPENIFILPETDEHIILFDFDSVVTLEELAGNNRIGLSFSKGFSPPEQIQGRRDKIGKHTDIYSIGALTFYKLFNRVATSQECNISATYPFGKMNYANEKYHPKLYRAINNFLRKTLSTAIIPRWHDMQPVIEALDELIRLSDIDGIYLLNSFQYDSAHFIGRNEEMEKIAEILSTNQLVFLSGIGGIGKTELAKQYANQYRDQYDTVTFSVFEKNIETLVCNEILIHKISQDEEESDTAYFERKIEILKQIATPRDLVIIDNFDVDSDEKLEILFRCPCKFIITTRMDFRDYNYKQIDVDRLRDPEDVLELFYTYNNKDYPGEENKAVERLVHYVDYHTMTVELIAKYLRNSEELPAELYGKFLQKEGTTNTEEINVKQRKDGKLNLKSVNNHLKILFDVSGFDAIEQEMIRSLSLLAGIRIEKSKFYQLCAVDDGENKLELLIRSGWVEYHAVSGKISLHQVIQDLVYKELAPNAENCPKIVEGMGRYVDLEETSEAEQKVKEKFFGIFMERLSGNTLPYVKLCLKYGKENKLDEAEKICLNSPEVKPFDLLPKIYRKKIKVIDAQIVDNILFESPEIEFSKSAAASEESLTLIGKLLDKIISYCQKNSKETDCIVKELIETGKEFDYMWMTPICLQIQERVSALDYVYNKIIQMFDIATEKLPLTSFSATQKEELYQEIQDFYYKKTDLSYKDLYFSDLKKVYQYQELIEQLRKDAAETIDIEDIAYLEETLAHNKEQGIYSYEIYVYLIKKLIEQENFEKVKKYIEELSFYTEQNTFPNNDPYFITYILSAYYFLYLLEQDPDRKKNLWGNCLKYYKMLGDHSIGNQIYDFILEYLTKEEIDYESIFKIMDRIAKDFQLKKAKEDIGERLIHCLEKKYMGRDDFKKYHVMLLIKLATFTFINMNSYEELKNGEKNCEKAQEYYNRYGFNDNYLQSLIYKTKAELMMSDKDFEYWESFEILKLCDFTLLAKQQISDYDYSVKEQIEIWRDAGLHYESTHNYEKMSSCFLQAINVSKPALNKYKFNMLNGGYQEIDDYREMMKAVIGMYILMKHYDSNYPMISELHNRTVDYAYSMINELYNQTADYLIEISASKHMEMENRIRGIENFDCNNNEDNDPINGIIDNSDIVDERIWWIEEISRDFSQIDKYDDAIRVCFVTIYLLLSPEIDAKLLKTGEDINKNLIQLCTKINELLNQEITTNEIDSLMNLKESIPMDKDLCSFDTKIFDSTLTKISDKFQYHEIEFKRQ